MCPKMAILLAFVAMTIAQLAPRAYDPLPLGTTKPAGWIRSQLGAQQAGLCGNDWLGGGGHANNPTFMFQADWQKNKWKPAIFVVSVMGLGTFIPCFMMNFAQKKAGVKWSD